MISFLEYIPGTNDLLGANLIRTSITINTLLKALTTEPFLGFNLCISLLDADCPTPTDEPDPLPALLPILMTLHDLLHQCRFPAFRTFYNSEELEPPRENYTIECIDFKGAIREVAARVIKATFTRIGLETSVIC
jgi:translation initiation factor 3 subunit K